MTTISIPLSDERALKLKELSAEFGMTPEDFIRISIEELLVQPERKFEHAVDHVLEKNAELYRRLA